MRAKRKEVGNVVQINAVTNKWRRSRTLSRPLQYRSEIIESDWRYLWAAYKVGFQLFFQIIGTSILMTILVMIGFLLLVIPGIYLLLAFMLTFQVIVIERVAGLTALKRSRELAKQNLLRILAIYVVTIIIMSILGAAVGLVLAPIPVLGVVGSALVQAVMSAYMPAAFVVLYFDIRCRKEAFDLEHLAQVVEGRAPAAVAAG